jgi:FkbM family methyltransferase
MHKLARIGMDFLGLTRICGPLVSLRWIWCVQLHLFAILKAGNLQAADEAMGVGPFEVTLKQYKCRFKIMGPRCISGIREMYVRDVYLKSRWLEIRPNDTVLDLGANMGNFTNMALAMEPTARVIAVEPSLNLNRVFEKSLDLNAGHLARTTLIRAILGEASEKIKGDEYYAGAEYITEGELLERVKAPHIDFVKCDIEGGEFKLLTRGSKLLAMARALACEVHGDTRDITTFIGDIEAAGFTIGPTQRARDGGSAVFLAKRTA